MNESYEEISLFYGISIYFICIIMWYAYNGLTSHNIIFYDCYPLLCLDIYGLRAQVLSHSHVLRC